MRASRPGRFSNGRAGDPRTELSRALDSEGLKLNESSATMFTRLRVHVRSFWEAYFAAKTYWAPRSLSFSLSLLARPTGFVGRGVGISDESCGAETFRTEEGSRDVEASEADCAGVEPRLMLKLSSLWRFVRLFTVSIVQFKRLSNGQTHCAPRSLSLSRSARPSLSWTSLVSCAPSSRVDVSTCGHSQARRGVGCGDMSRRVSL